MSFDLQSYIKECQRMVDKALDESMPGPQSYPATLHQAMRYSLLAEGKRIRPILCFAASEACGGGRREVLNIACALEMIHAFSLIHDDLPAMDDDSLRRGRPTNHMVYGEAVAILAGDGLLAQAFVVLGKLKDASARQTSRILEIIYDLSLATGSIGMVGGQVVDMESEGKTITLDQLRQLHRFKTGKLITAAVLCGAKFVTDDVAKISALETYGECVGLAFQIADDILDIEGGAEIGKDVGSDVENGKSTYPSLMGLAAAKKEGSQVVERAIEAIKGFGPEADPLRAIATYIIERKK